MSVLSPLEADHQWPHAEAARLTAGAAYRPCAAEVAECSCPDFCERDHDND